MARSVRSGVLLRLGVLSTPVNLTTAVDQGSAPKTKTVCASDHPPAKTSQTLACVECGNSQRSTFLKGVPSGDGFVVVDEDAIDGIVDDDVKNTVSLTAHPAEDLVGQTVEGGKVYFLSPSKGGQDVYVLLRETVKARRDIALLSEFAVRGKPSLFQLGTFRDALVLTEVAWPEAIREAPAPEATVPDGALEMLGQIIDKSVTPYDPELYRDTRAEALRAAIEAAHDGVEPVIKPAVVKEPGADLMAALSAALGDAA